MATITATTSSAVCGSRAVVVTWTALANGDYGSSFVASQYADKSVQAAGTFGTGGTVVLQGSNDGSNWATLTDAQGNAISFTSAGVKSVVEATLYVRPFVSGGDGTTSLTFTLFAKG